MIYKKNDTFEIKPEHLLLLQQAYIDWDNGNLFGSPAVSTKRPYGNGDIIMDIAQILGLPIDKEGELSGEDEKLAIKIHKETGITLQICLVLQKFEVGLYLKTADYDDRAWIKK